MATLLLERPPSPEPPRPERRVEGVIPVGGRELRIQRRITLVMTLVPFAAVVWAAIALWGHGIGGVEAGIATGFYLFTALGVTVGFHRYFTHKGFTAVQPVRTVMAVAGSMAVQGSIISWVAAHRRHHAYSDKPGDPHSPYLEFEGDGAPSALKGLWHAHVGWLFQPEKTDVVRWAPDMVKDPMVAAVDRAFQWLVLASFLLPAVLGYAITGTWHGAWGAFLWGSLVRIFLLHHVTWSINSICHFYGTKPYESKDESRNNWMLSILSMGESWHNNHHAFPSAARHGIDRGQVDISARVIQTMARLGWVTDVRTVDEAQREAKRRR